MPFPGLHLALFTLAALLVVRPVLAVEPGSLVRPPPEQPPQPPALTRAPLDARQPLELLAHARAWTPLRVGAGDGSSALGAAAGVGFRTSPYFSVGPEGSVLRVAGPGGGSSRSFELSAVGRVYLLEAGWLDPFLELALGYGAERGRTDGSDAALAHGPSTRAGGGLDLIVAPPLRLGVHLSYREVARLRSPSCGCGSGVRTSGGLLAGVALTLPLGEPL